MASVGGFAAAIVEPRQAFKAAVLVARNYPPGDPEPSREDAAVTRQLVEAGEVVGTPVHDHLIVADRGHDSFTDAHLAFSSRGRTPHRVRP